MLGVLVLLLGLCPTGIRAQGTDGTHPLGTERRGVDRELKEEVASAVNAAIEARETPGGVVWVGRGDERLLWEAWGRRRVVPSPQPMEPTTRFDCASLTKPVACATSVLKLVDIGKLRLDAAVATWFPEFGTKGKEAITVRQLLQHRSGLLADNAVADYAKGADAAWKNICDLGLKAPVGTTTIYSDVGYIVLGRLVEKIDGRRLDRFARDEVFLPLGMSKTDYLPDPSIRDGCAATEPREGKMLQGVVHDPRAHLLGGVAGHAGLFSTADDLARWCRMVLGEGAFVDGTTTRRVLSKETARLLVTGTASPDGSGVRTLGLDADPKAFAKGDFFPTGSCGHTGFTGTALWLDPSSHAYVVTLSTRLHPDGKGDTKTLRRKVATAAARATLATSTPTESRPSRMKRP